MIPNKCQMCGCHFNPEFLKVYGSMCSKACLRKKAELEANVMIELRRIFEESKE